MASARFFWIYDLGRYRADAYIRCRNRRCDHQAILTLKRLRELKVTMLRWHHAEARMRCSKCGLRGQRIIPVPVPHDRPTS